jgi:hypothetical protein
MDEMPGGLRFASDIPVDAFDEFVARFRNASRQPGPLRLYTSTPIGRESYLDIAVRDARIAEACGGAG